MDIDENLKLKIVVAEDEENWRDYMALKLSSAGYRVYPAQDGMEAYHLYETVHPDILILDVDMPYADGLSLARRIHASNAKVLIIFMSGLEKFENEVEAYQLGALHFFRKPFEIDTLLAYLRRLDIRSVVAFGNCTFAPATRVLDVAGVSRVLSRNQAVVLGELCRNPGQPVNRKVFFTALYGHDRIYSRSLDTLVSELRKRLAGDPSVTIKPCYDEGYQLVIHTRQGIKPLPDAPG